MSPRWPSLSMSSCRMIFILFSFAPVAKSVRLLAGLKPSAYIGVTDLKIGHYIRAVTPSAFRLLVAPLGRPGRAVAALLVRACLWRPPGLPGGGRGGPRRCARRA